MSKTEQDKGTYILTESTEGWPCIQGLINEGDACKALGMDFVIVDDLTVGSTRSMTVTIELAADLDFFLGLVTTSYQVNLGSDCTYKEVV